MKKIRKQPKKDFDVLAFKAKTQAEIAQDISGMSRAEEIEYFRKSTSRGPLSGWWARVKDEQVIKRRKKLKDAA